MIKNNMNKKIEVNIPNRIFYSVISLIVVILVLTGVYAFGGSSPSVVGHSIGELQPPYQCTSYLKYDSSSGWTCSNPPSSTPTITCTGANKGLQWNGAAWSCATYTSGGDSEDSCAWVGWNDPCGDDVEYAFGTTCSGGYLGVKRFCASGTVTQTQKVTCCPTSYNPA